MQDRSSPARSSPVHDAQNLSSAAWIQQRSILWETFYCLSSQKSDNLGPIADVGCAGDQAQPQLLSCRRVTMSWSTFLNLCTGLLGPSLSLDLNRDVVVT